MQILDCCWTPSISFTEHSRCRNAAHRRLDVWISFGHLILHQINQVEQKCSETLCREIGRNHLLWQSMQRLPSDQTLLSENSVALSSDISYPLQSNTPFPCSCWIQRTVYLCVSIASDISSNTQMLNKMQVIHYMTHTNCFLWHRCKSLGGRSNNYWATYVQEPLGDNRTLLCDAMMP